MKHIYLFTLLASFLVSPIAFGALNAYLVIEGETTGPIEGEVTLAGREGSIMVIGFSHEIFAPRDAATGRPTGKRQHEPIRITKEIGRSTPLLMNALVNNERLTKFELHFWRPNSLSGQEEQFYTIELLNARIVAIRQEMLNNKYPENMQHKEREHVTFTYDRILWTYENEGITAEDQWAYEGVTALLSDLNGDGVVNILDMALFSREWLYGINTN